jgi:hypothetical protein
LFPSQSGKSNSLHQPVGLMSPFTTLQLRGRMKNVQTAQLNMPWACSDMPLQAATPSPGRLVGTRRDHGAESQRRRNQLPPRRPTMAEA